MLLLSYARAPSYYFHIEGSTTGNALNIKNHGETQKNARQMDDFFYHHRAGTGTPPRNARILVEINFQRNLTDTIVVNIGSE